MPNFLEPLINPARLVSSPLSLAEKILYWTAVLTPVWWLSGIQTLFYPAVVIFLLLYYFRFDTVLRRRLPLCVWAWLIMTVFMLWTTILGLEDMSAGLTTVAAAMVTFFKSYLLIFAAIALPFFSRIRLPILTRGIVLMTLGMLVNLIVQMGLLVAGMSQQVLTPPLARLIPGDVSSSLLVKTASFEFFAGLPVPRTILHTADPPILGVCSLLCFLICLNETNRPLRNWALFSTICTLIISFSRTAWIGFIASLILLACLRYATVRQLPLWLTAITLSILSWFELTVGALLQKPQEIFDSARASSSSTRALVVKETLEAWQEKLWLGWGVIRGRAWIYDDNYITLGSFSTYAAVLYLNGVIGFVVFILALGLTVADFYSGAIRNHFACQIALVGFLILCILIQATPLSWMAIYLWFFFVWIGAVLQEYRQETQQADRLSWEQLVHNHASSS
ncbi:O-antigen ligase family protein [Leptolyngbya sp. BC1307]|uniref:O-antigen ligase family protein n=1 Tax=Leptolyngbya sp. BC1307 TaxID=2029589 RepID=UPI000EFA3D1C|nr:O-antigen ligase family protein [Leptolyngbya sp. BC1307]